MENKNTNNSLIKLTDVKVEHGGVTVLDHVNIELVAGDLCYLIGKTGSGKSSLLKLLYGELELQSGTAEVGDFELKRLKKKYIPHLRRQLGIVFQDFQLLWDRTVQDNLEFVMKATGWKDKNQIKNQIAIVLEMVGLQGKEQVMPHRLSGGEQQRVSIARALVNNPDIILADEPTGNLDPETAGEIMQLLFEIAQNGRAVLISTHDYPMMKQYPGKILKCEGQEIKEVLVY